MVFFNSSVVYKTSQAFERRFKLHPLVRNLLDNVLLFICLKFNKDINGRITDTVSTRQEDALLGRESTTHYDGRAFDLSIRGLTEEEIQEIEISFTQVAGHIGAWIKEKGTDGKSYRCLIKDHDTGWGRHLHFQIGKDIKEKFKY